MFFLLDANNHQKKSFELQENQILVLQGRGLVFECLSGSIWVTGPPGRERVITAGRRACMDATGTICVQAFQAFSLVVKGAFRLKTPFPASRRVAVSGAV